MSVRSRVRTFGRAVFRAADLRGQVSEELAFHIESYATELERRGVPRDEAMRRARMELGSRERVREEVNRASGGEMVRAFWGDLRYAIRALKRSPGFALAAVGTLALGIGAVTAVFSVVNTVLLKPFGFPDPGRLVVVRETEPKAFGPGTQVPVSYRHYLRMKTTSKTLEDAAIFQDSAVSVSPKGDRPEIMGGVTSSPNLLRVLGVQPLMGRDFVASDAVKGSPEVAILSYEGWKELTGSDPKAIGKTVRVDGGPMTVIGVLPPGVMLPKIAWGDKIAGSQGIGQGETMLYMTAAPSDYDLKQDTGNFNYKMIARLKPGVTVAQAQAELETLQRGYTQSAHLPIEVGAVVTPLAADVTRGISGALWMMLAAVCGVLLIGCVNLANLQLARAVTAERETAVRAARGANRARLLQARLAESVVLAVAGGMAGVALAFVGMRGLLALAPANVPRLNQVHMSWPVLLFAAGLSIAAAIGFGIVPALKGMRVRPETALRANTTRVANTHESRRARSALVAAQVTCTVALLLVTALVLRSFSRLLGEKLGFDASHVTLAVVELYAPQYAGSLKNVQAVKLRFTDRALEALRGLPGVQQVAVTSTVPMTGENWVDDLIRPDHPVPEAQRPPINVRWINPEYLTTMQMARVSGRNITEADRANPYVVMISERAAREGFSGENPVGKKIELDLPGVEKAPLATIVGVVADDRINGLKDTASMLYAPYWLYTPWTLSFLVRGAQPPDALMPEMRKAIWGIDPQVAIPTLKSMDEQVSDSVATERFQTTILGCFGAAALLLALVGIYGVLAYSVSMRTQEFGIRMALGSGRGALVGLVLRQAAGPVLLGTAAGLAVAFAAMGWVRSLLYQTSVVDPVAIAGSLLLLLGAALLAALMPARRAAGIDPARAIREE
ncbi:MAG TPA: ABC transporter permease [Terracidiphilus sp.]|nr:ABC transporter permease [Terracidiphilus sp.]